MKKYRFVPFVLGILCLLGIIYAIATNKTAIDKEGGVTTKKDALVTQTVSYEKDGTTFSFTKNRITKTANVSLSYPIADKDEYGDFMGSQVTMAPFLINMLCGILNQAFYEPESLPKASEEASQAASITTDDEFKNALEGYAVSEYSIHFTDKETREPIASCRSSQKGFEHIIFSVTRDYSGKDSFFGQQIGVIEKNESAQ